MGRKPTRKGKHLYLSIAGLILLSPLGCATIEKTTVQVEVSTASVETKEVTDTGTSRLKTGEPERMGAAAPGGSKEQERTKEDIMAHEHLLHGQKLFIQGDYEGSLKEYKEVLSLSANRTPADEALFNMGLIYAHPGNAKRNLATSLSVFQRLMKDYPQSPWAGQAKIWAELFQENETLKQVIEKSKQVDIEIEERKREKAR
jgi:tetratricopeptide (TPR) repeat protein